MKKTKRQNKELQLLKKRQTEANARRKVARNWDSLSKSCRYRMAAIKDACSRVTSKVKEEVLDGMFLDLSERNSNKSNNVQKRILRRIVEKRQAQASHRIMGRSGDLRSTYVSQACYSRSMESIHHQQWML